MALDINKLHQRQKEAGYRAAVMKHYADGGLIQFRIRNGSPAWVQTYYPEWDWRDMDYRIAPEGTEPMRPPSEVP